MVYVWVGGCVYVYVGVCVCVCGWVCVGACGCVGDDHTCVHINPTNPTQPNRLGHVLIGMVFWAGNAHTIHNRDVGGGGSTLLVEILVVHTGVGQVERDVTHDVTQHLHFNVTINHPVPRQPLCG